MCQLRNRLPLAAIVLALAAAPAWALKSDRQQPVRLDADRAQLNNATGVSVYTGDVVLVQGSMKLTADKMTVHTTPKGELIKVVAEGRNATFTQLPEGQTVPVQGKAPNMEYQASATGQVFLRGGATLTQGRNTFSGETIHYDMGKDLVTAQGGAQGKGGRIRMTYFPETAPGESEERAPE